MTLARGHAAWQMTRVKQQRQILQLRTKSSIGRFNPLLNAVFLFR